MAASEAQKRATKKWLKEKTEEFKLRMPKGRKAEIQTHAAERGESLNSFINRAINEAVQRDTDVKQG